MILVTGALHAEGKTTATARLGRALAQAGRKTLLVSVDLRVPRLHEMFDLDLGMGVSDILAVLDWDPESLDSDLIEQATHVVMSSARRDEGRGELHVITSGTKAKDPGRLISGRALGVFLNRLRQLDYDYVLVDGPPLLGIADSQLVAQQVDDLLVVSRLDRITIEHATELRDVLDRLPTPPVGIVVIGARGEMSPYYLSRRPGLLQEETSG
jgi:Mrp family chromosome partitioning ATPase